MKTTDELKDETRAELATMRVVVDGEDYTITGCDNPERLLLRTALAYQPRYGYYAETPTRNAITSTTLRMQDGGGEAHTLRVVFCVADKSQHAYMDSEELDDGSDGALIALGVPATTDFDLFPFVWVDYSGAVEQAMRLFPAGRGYSDGVEITTEERGITKTEELHGDRLRDARGRAGRSAYARLLFPQDGCCEYSPVNVEYGRHDTCFPSLSTHSFCLEQLYYV